MLCDTMVDGLLVKCGLLQHSSKIQHRGEKVQDDLTDTNMSHWTVHDFQTNTIVKPAGNCANMRDVECFDVELNACFGFHFTKMQGQCNISVSIKALCWLHFFFLSLQKLEACCPCLIDLVHYLSSGAGPHLNHTLIYLASLNIAILPKSFCLWCFKISSQSTTLRQNPCAKSPSAGPRNTLLYINYSSQHTRKHQSGNTLS